jgi:hypothetical protein
VHKQRPKLSFNNKQKTLKDNYGTTKAIRKRSEKGCEVDQGRPHRRQETTKVAQGILLGWFFFLKKLLEPNFFLNL